MIVGCLFAVMLQAQDPRQKAMTHPLECAQYLLSNDDLNGHPSGSLTRTWLKVGRYDDAIRAFRIEKPDVHELVLTAEERFKAGDLRNSRKLALTTYDLVKDEIDGSHISEIAGLLRVLTFLSETAIVNEILDRAGDEQKFEFAIELARAHLLTGDKVAAKRILADAFVLSTDLIDQVSESGLMAAGLFALELGERGLAVVAADHLDKRSRQKESLPGNYYSNLFTLYSLAGEREKAMSAWNRNSNKDESYDRVRFISAHIDINDSSTARQLLSTIAPDDRNGSEVVKQYIRLGDIQRAEQFAHMISNDPDSYDQQEAYMHLVDHFIAKRDLLQAKCLLNYALKRAVAIPFKHEAMDSIGASSGSRRSQMAFQIRSRFERLGDVEGSWAAVDALNDPHSYAQEQFLQARIDFVIRNFKALSRKRIGLLLDLTIRKGRSEQDDFSKVQLLTRSAEVYALLGEKSLASDLIAELLEDRFEDEYLVGEALLTGGTVFEQYRLPATIRMQRILAKIMKENE